jgi:peptidyl-prolyl cis-trans isomerase C
LRECPGRIRSGGLPPFAKDRPMTSQPLPSVSCTPSVALRHSGIVAAAAALLLACSVPAFAQSTAPQGADPVVARVNGQEIHESDLTIAEEDIGGNLPQQAGPDQKRDYLITYLADMILVAKAAEADKLADSDSFKQRLVFARNKALMESMLQSQAKTAVNDTAMHHVYDEAVKQMGEQQEVRARHILVESEDEAKSILADLKKGGDFAEIAKKKSKDPSAAAEGGDLGYFTKDQMVPEFSEVAFKLDKGQLSDPVHSQFGWHIIQVEDKRVKPVPQFDQVKDQIETFVVRKAQADLVSKLRADGKIERLDKPAAEKPIEDKSSEPKK